MPSRMAFIFERHSWRRLDSHLHLFQIGDDIYGMHNPHWEPLGLDESRYRLRDVFAQVGTKMLGRMTSATVGNTTCFWRGSICAPAR